MKIHHFNTESGGGAYTYAQRLSDALKGIGHESVLHTKPGIPGGVCSASGTSRWLQRGRYSLENRMLVANSPSYYSRLAEFHRTPAPQGWIDVAHLHWIGRWLDLGSFVHSLVPDVPVVWTVHDMSPLAGGCFTEFGCDEFGHGCRKCPLLRWPMNHFWARQELSQRVRILKNRKVAFVANSEATLKLIQQSEVAHDHILECIHPGFDFSQTEQLEKNLAKARWGLPKDSFVLGFAAVSLTDGNKGIDRFYEVAKSVAEKVPNTRALLVGDGKPDEQIPSVRTGLLGEEKDLNAAYSAMDVLVITSKMESFGQVSVEAQACGTPVWAFAVGGIPETLQNGKTGQLAEFGDIAALAEGIQAAKKNGSLANMSRKAGKFSREMFNHLRFAEQYACLYGKLIKKTNPPVSAK